MGIIVISMFILSIAIFSKLNWKACNAEFWEESSYFPKSYNENSLFNVYSVKECTLEDQLSYKWRNDPQLMEICSDQGRTVASALFKRMPRIHLIEDKQMVFEAFLPENMAKYNPELPNIVLDMDETLATKVESDPLEEEIIKVVFTEHNPKMGEDAVTTHNYKLRPYLLEFLQHLQGKFNIFLFTMSNYEKVSIIFKESGINQYFVRAICAEDVVGTEPLPKVHMKFIQKLFHKSNTISWKNTIHLDDRTGPGALHQTNFLKALKYGGTSTDSFLFTMGLIINWILNCYTHIEGNDIRNCIATLKSEFHGYFDGYLSDENSDHYDNNYSTHSTPKTVQPLSNQRQL